MGAVSDLCPPRQQDGKYQAVSVIEVSVDRPSRDTGGLGDILHGRLGNPVSIEAGLGGTHQRLPDVLRVRGRLGPPAGRRIPSSLDSGHSASLLQLTRFALRTTLYKLRVL
jgi:hypothetical protein